MSGGKVPDAYAAARHAFIRKGPADRLPGCTRDRETREWVVACLGRPYRVATGGAVLDPEGRPAAFNPATLVLQYLAGASGLPPRGRWLSFLELPEGVLHHVPFVEQILKPLARFFGRRGEAFAAAGRLLGGRELTLADRSFLVEALPRLPLAVLLWEEDEEFPARADILFDAVAPTSLPTASLWVLGQELAKVLMKHVTGE